MTARPWILLALAFVPFAGCDKKTSPPPAPPPEPAAPPAPEAKPEPQPEPPKVPEDAMAVGMFNLEWAFDNVEEKWPKSAKPNVAKTEEDWAWKRDQISALLVAEKLDIVVLTETGGEREISDFTMTIRENGGPDYDYAFLASGDKATGQEVAILSRFPLTDTRRLDTSIKKHVAVDVELPTGDKITVVALHLREGTAPAYAAKRRRAVRALRKKLRRELADHPHVFIGTLNSKSSPVDDDYAKKVPGILAGKANRNEEDDCFDSGSDATGTTVAGDPLDRIISCGLEMRGAEVSAENKIVREDDDPADSPWPTIPINEPPHRDVSDHYLLWAEIVMPKKPEPEKPAKGEGGDTAASDKGSAGGGS